MTTETPTAPKARSFVDTLAKLRYGQCVEDLTTELHQLLCAVNRTGRAGKLTLTIKVKPVDKGASVERIQISDDITATVPKPERGSTFMFLDAQNNPTPNDPRQPQLPLRVVADEAKPREVSNG
jgi:hypothetical protein